MTEESDALPEVIRLGTRRSALAMAQSGMVARDLEAVTGRRVELVQIVSEGDTNRASLASLGGTGVFATRLREALLAGECDLLVHSLKDLPTAPAPGLVIAATPRRADARDVIITRDGTPLEQLPAGARVGTGSPRRIAQVRAANPAVEIHDLRGNVDSRMARVRDGELDAIVLAAAGLTRLGAEIDLHVEPRDLEAWPTAAGQGVLAVETRADAAPELLAALRRLDDPITRFAQEVERSILAGIEAGCHAPVGVHAAIDGDRLRVRADVLGSDPAQTVSADETVLIGGEGLIGPISATRAEGYSQDSGSADGDAPGAIPRPSDIGDEIARRLLAAGASELVSGPPTP